MNPRSPAREARFRQINVPLDATQDFIADHILIAEFDDRAALGLKRFMRQAFVFRRKKAQWCAGILWLGAFHLTDVVFVLDL